MTDTTFSGTVTLDFPDGEQDVGEFSVTKGAAAPPPTDPPPTDVPYYGEWAWSFDSTSDVHNEGRFSIWKKMSRPGIGGGTYQECSEGACANEVAGGVLFGPDDAGRLSITMLNPDLLITYEAIDSDGELAEDSQGQMVFEGQSRYYDLETGDYVTGTFTATLTDLPVAFPGPDSLEEVQAR